MVFSPSSLLSRELLPLAVGAASAVVLGAWLLRSTRSQEETHKKVLTLPTSRAVVGDLLEYLQNADRFHDWLTENCLLLHNEPWRLRIFGQKDMIVVSSPEAFEDIFVTQFDNFPRGEYLNSMFEDVFGKSMITFDGEQWYRQRKAAAKFFTAKALRICMLKIMHKNVLQMYDTLDGHIASGEPADFTRLLHQFTLQTFTEIGLGIDLRWIGMKEPHPLEEIDTVGSAATMRRFRLPDFYWKLERLLNFGPEKQLAQAMKEVRQWFGSILEQSLKSARHHQANLRHEDESDEPVVKSVVELFVESSDEEMEGLRPEDLPDFLLSFVLAAQDTSALTLGWFFYAVNKFPEVEVRIRREMEAILPTLDVTEDTYLTTDHVSKLVYFEATIRETLRLYATVPLTQKVTVNDTTICGGVPLKAGEGIILSMYALARNPRVWGPDAAEFKPERWIDQATGDLLSFPPTKFASFGAGPRICIGMKLGMLEVRVVAANLLRRYNLKLISPNDGGYLVGVSLVHKDPLEMRISRATASASVKKE